MTNAPLIALELPTPAGTLAVLVSPEDGVVRASGFTAPSVLLGRLPLPLRARGTVPAPSGARGADDVGASGGSVRALGTVRDAVKAYSAGDFAALDTVVVEQDGGPFFQEVWRAMREIPAGTTLSYAELAARAGNPGAVRAAGSASAPSERSTRWQGKNGASRFRAHALPAARTAPGFPARAASSA